MTSHPLSVGDRVYLPHTEETMGIRLIGTVIDVKSVSYGTVSCGYFAHVCWDAVDGRPVMDSSGVPLGSQWLPTTAVKAAMYMTEAAVVR